MGPVRLAVAAAGFVLTAVWLGGCVPPLPGGALEGAAGSSGGATSTPGGVGGMAAAPVATGSGGLGAPDAATACLPAACTQEPSCAEPAWTGSPVSSFETACGTVDAVDGRDGGWFVYTTANSTATPGPTDPFRVSCPGADGSCFSACVSGTLNGNGSDWPTVGIGFTPRANAGAYDASRYTGIDFWMRALVGPSSTLRLLVPLKADTMVGNGDGSCTAGCFDAYNVVLPAKPVWQRFQVPFTDLRQQGFGAPEPWDPTTVISFQWAVAATVSPALFDEPYAICLDQIQLLP